METASFKMAFISGLMELAYSSNMILKGVDNENENKKSLGIKEDSSFYETATGLVKLQTIPKT